MKVDLKTKKAKVIHEKRNKKTRRNKSMVKTKIIKKRGISNVYIKM